MKIAVYLFLSLMLFSCTKTEHVDSEAVYQSLTPDQQDVWDYFIRYNNTTEVATVGVTELLDLGGQISGFDQLRVPFSFYGDVLVIDETDEYLPRMGEGIPFSQLTLLHLIDQRRGECAPLIDDMFNDLDYNPRMRPSRTKIFFSEGGFYEYIYYDRIPSKTRPGITYNVDFEIL
ncbi:MAG: hypothetical protein PHH72_04980 [Parabacteroides sp.]|jgi:hypothetical protein|nr:hypothetical protein [Parabacteroides sp.]MDD3358353.1 hypothetical protein [Parabacteroides sp.]